MKNKLLLIVVSIIATQTMAMEQQTPEPTLRWADNAKDDFLFRAVLAKDLALVKRALKDGANIEARCTTGIDKGQTPLSVACYHSDQVIVQHLLSSGADCNACGDRGYTPLHNALLNLYTPSCIPMVEALVRHGADVGIQKNTPENSLVTQGSTVLHRIAEIMHYTRFGDKKMQGSYDISTAEEVFERLKLLLTVIVKEIICQSHRENKRCVPILHTIFSKQDANNKAAYQLFEKYDDFKVMLTRPSPNRCEHPEQKNHTRWDKLDYKLCLLLYPDRVEQYCCHPFNLNTQVRNERVYLE